MSNKPRWELVLELLPGSLAANKLLPIFRLLLDDDALLSVVEVETVSLEASDKARALAENYAYFRTQSKHGTVTIKGPGEAFITFELSTNPGYGGSIVGYIPSADELVVTDRVAKLVQLLEAPIAYVYDSHGLDEREDLHRDATKAVHGEDTFPFGIRWGLPGLMYRTFLGRPFVDMIGEQKLQALGHDLAWKSEDCWIVAGSPTPEAWQLDPPNGQERSIIEQLGSEMFFDVQTGRLPTKLPDLPPHPSHPVWLRNQDTDVLEEITTEPDGSTTRKPVITPALVTAHLRPNFEEQIQDVFEDMTRLVPDFIDDSPISWVELRLGAFPPEVHKEVLADYAPWVGDYISKATGAVWTVAETNEGTWHLTLPNGTVLDPFGYVEKFLKGEETSLQAYVRSAIEEGFKP